ncbi:MAG: DUF4295 family protein [Chitinophagales bacterium]
MAKVSKNSRINRGGGKDHVKIVIPEKNPKTGAYVYKEKVIHKDELKEALKGY